MKIDEFNPIKKKKKINLPSYYHNYELFIKLFLLPFSL